MVPLHRTGRIETAVLELSTVKHELVGTVIAVVEQRCHAGGVNMVVARAVEIGVNIEETVVRPSSG